MARSSQWSLPFGPLNQNLVNTCLSQLILLDLITLTIFGEDTFFYMSNTHMYVIIIFRNVENGYVRKNTKICLQVITIEFGGYGGPTTSGIPNFVAVYPGLGFSNICFSMT
jgi:hypothetical protein